MGFFIMVVAFGNENQIEPVFDVKDIFGVRVVSVEYLMNARKNAIHIRLAQGYNVRGTVRDTSPEIFIQDGTLDGGKSPHCVSFHLDDLLVRFKFSLNRCGLRDALQTAAFVSIHSKERVVVCGEYAPGADYFSGGNIYMDSVARPILNPTCVDDTLLF